MQKKKLPQPRFTIRLNNEGWFEPIPYRPFVFSTPFKLNSGDKSIEYYSLLKKEKDEFLFKGKRYYKHALFNKISFLIVHPILKHLIRICTFHIIELQNAWCDEIVEIMNMLLTDSKFDTLTTEINLMIR